MPEDRRRPVRVATQYEKRHWNELIVQNPDGGSFLQTREFAELKEKDHWKPRYFIIRTDTGTVALLALCRLVFPLGYLWYVPKGPGVLKYEDFKNVYQTFRGYVKQNHRNVFLLQFEPELPATIKMAWIREEKQLWLAPPIQASTATVIVSLSPPPKVMFALFSKRARYYIRLGIRENIHVRELGACEANFRQMYKLMTTVSGGKGVPGIRPYEYYRNFWQQFMLAGSGRLYFAYEDGVPVVGAFVIVVGGKAAYKDGGSCPHRSSKGASYLLQWHIISQLRVEGVKTYDMWGALPGARQADTSHPYYGVNLFKTAFNKNITEYCGILDSVLSPSRYNVWRKVFYPLLRRIKRVKRSYFY
jgi:serine/alanine adding enzyme